MCIRLQLESSRSIRYAVTQSFISPMNFPVMIIVSIHFQVNESLCLLSCSYSYRIFRYIRPDCRLLSYTVNNCWVSSPPFPHAQIKKRKTTAFAGILRFRASITLLISRRPELKPLEVKPAAWQEQEGYSPAAAYRLKDKFPLCVAV